MNSKNKVILVCTSCNSRNYTTKKSAGSAAKRIELKKYCKHCDEYTLHKETR